MKHYIRWLQITMHNALLHQCPITSKYLRYDVECLFLRQIPQRRPLDFSFQCAPITKLCDEKAVMVILSNLEPFQDILTIHCHNSNPFHSKQVVSNLIVNGP